MANRDLDDLWLSDPHRSSRSRVPEARSLHNYESWPRVLNYCYNHAQLSRYGRDERLDHGHATTRLMPHASSGTVHAAAAAHQTSRTFWPTPSLRRFPIVVYCCPPKGNSGP
jgi:hypothetical protein